MVRSTSGFGGVGLLTSRISVLTWIAGASAAVDLSGKWRVEYSPTTGEFIDVTQTGTAVTTELHQPGGFPGDVPLEGTFDEPTGSLSLQVPGCSPPSCFSGMSIRMLPSGNDGNGLLVIGGPPLPGIGAILMNRCDCYDGNTVDGDGCDANCRVERCFTCSGTPSVCTPEPDGAACEDGSPCTTAQQCTAGVCGGGSSITPCVDMTGIWDEHIVDSVFGLSTDVVLRIQQRDTTVLFRNAVTGAASFLGTVDSATGAFDLRAPETIPLCPAVDGLTLTGTASLDNQHFSGTGTGHVATLRFCLGDTFAGTGARRAGDGDGTVEPGEICDDGNLVDGDGCDSNCTPTACGNGIVTAPEACDDGNVVDGDGCDSNCTIPSCGNGIANPGEECDDGNAVSGDGCDANCTSTRCGNDIVTAGEACDDGNTTSGDGCDAACAVEPCYRCTGTEPSTCATTYRPVCSAPTRPGQARLEVSQLADDGRDALEFRTKKGSALDTALLGDPTASTPYDVC